MFTPTKEIPEEIRKSLIKKWKGNLTRYYKLRDNNWMRITKRGMVTINCDCTATKDFYLKEIAKWERIISELSPKQ